MFVKICGIANETDALLAAGLGADAVGLIFAPSTRQITKDIARDIVRRLPPEILSVGVFRNESRSRVVEIANTVGLRAVQLHGHETAEDTRWIAERVPAVIRAFAVGDPALDRLDEFGKIDLLIDSATPGAGEVFDWQQLAKRGITRPFILAGGLGPDNVADAIRTLRPWGVDIASGVEASPGRKDPVKLRRFIANARAAFEELPESAEPPFADAEVLAQGDDLDGDDLDSDDLGELANDWLSATPTRIDQRPADESSVDTNPAPTNDSPLFDWNDDPLWK